MEGSFKAVKGVILIKGKMRSGVTVAAVTVIFIVIKKVFNVD